MSVSRWRPACEESQSDAHGLKTQAARRYSDETRQSTSIALLWSDVLQKRPQSSFTRLSGKKTFSTKNLSKTLLLVMLMGCV